MPSSGRGNPRTDAGDGQGAGGIEVADEPVEQVAECAGVDLVPARKSRQGPLGPEGTRTGEGRGALRREPEQAGPAVIRVGAALDVTAPLERGDLPAGDRDVDPRVRRESAAPLFPRLLEGHEECPAEGRQLAVELAAARELTCRPVRTSRAMLVVSRSRVSGLMGTGPPGPNHLYTATISLVGCRLQHSAPGR